MTNALQVKRIHFTGQGDVLKTQEDALTRPTPNLKKTSKKREKKGFIKQYCCLGRLFKHSSQLRGDDEDDDEDSNNHAESDIENKTSSSTITPSQQHNHRPLTKLQYLQFHANALDEEMNKKGKKRNKSSITKVEPLFSEDNDITDRKALESFFQSTHQSDSDWTSADVLVGNGRSNWLDKSKSIDKWQGISVMSKHSGHSYNYNDGSASSDVSEIGRVIRFHLPRNNIAGKRTHRVSLLLLFLNDEKIISLPFLLMHIFGGTKNLSLLKLITFLGCLDALEPLTVMMKLNLSGNSLHGECCCCCV